jgi:hypothetical protein
MPWKECHIMDERLRFVARLLEGEKMAPLCAEFGISRTCRSPSRTTSPSSTSSSVTTCLQL